MKKLQSKIRLSSIQIAIFGFVLAVVVFGGVYILSRPKAQGMITKTMCESGVTCISLKANHAEPDAITVPVNSYVQINSADGQTHDIASGTGDDLHNGEHMHTEGAESGNFKADEAWKIKMSQTGTYDFHDHYHPTIHFTVVVYKPGGDYKIK